MKAVPTNSVSTPSFTAARGIHCARRRILWLLAVAGMVSLPEAALSSTFTVCTPTGGTVSPSPGTHATNNIVSIPISATPDPGYRFVQWHVSGAGLEVVDPYATDTTMRVTGYSRTVRTLCPEFELVSPPSATVIVPNVAGMTQSQAQSALASAGLAVGTITNSPSPTVPQGQVISQNPMAGTQVPSGSLVSLTVSTGAAPAGPAAPGLVAHWKLDETAGSIAPDSVGGHNGTVYGNPVWLPNQGKIGGALNFDGADDHVNCGTFNPSAATGKLSVCLWARWNGQPRAWQGLIAKRNGWSPADVMWSLEADINTGKLGFFHYSSVRFGGDPVLPLDEWTHVAVSCDGRTATMYIGGQPTGSGAFSFPPVTQATVVLGASTPEGYNAFNGALDDIQLYDRALSQAQIQAVMTGTSAAEPATPGAEVLVAHWKLDETTGRIAADSVGLCAGVLIGGPVWQPAGGKVAGALKFDGLNDCIVTDFVPNPPEGPFRALAWIKGGAPGQVILSQDGALGGTDWLAASALGRLTTALGGGQPLTSSKIIVDDQWHEVGLTWDGSSRTLSVDGVAVATDKPAAFVGSLGGLTIGVGRNLGAGTYWSGLIDEVRIYRPTTQPTGQ